MLHPFAVVTMLARSTAAFSNLFLALALDAALGGERELSLSIRIDKVPRRICC